jgi:putative hydrolase
MSSSTLNGRAARILRECAQLLEQQGANPFRIGAYARAADVLESLPEDVSRILRREGRAGLMRLPGIGRGLAAAIDEIDRTGRLTQLDRLRGESHPEVLFQSVPGVGPAIARALHEALDVDSLEGLEVAAHDRRLDAVPGIGPRRATAIRAGLASMLGRRLRYRPEHQPDPELLLEIDREYRDRARAGKLLKIAPRRFNPGNQAWLPVMHAERNGWHFTVLYSNTARAHDLDRTHDWVVIYFYDGDHEEGQSTVVTETQGLLKGRRVIRGREEECRRLFE